ncbi:phage tail protein, partial [Campylobacter coli]|nr:phage tail protein [Campylobacter coli]ELJ4922369.1 phage tail protein [Campylobacter coli]ELN9515035.1 phage tail protein [Campylobacter coli]
NAVGIYDEAGDLLAVGNLPRTYKPILKEGSAKELMIKIVMELSNAEEVILKLDPSVIMASRDYVDAIKIELKLEIETLMQQYNDAFKKVWDELSKYLLESKFNTEIAKYVTLTTKQDINGIKNFTKLPTSNLQASKDEEFVNLGTLKKLISSLSNGLGVGQRYVDCIHTRSPNVTYTNTTGKPIMIITDSGAYRGKVNYYVDGNFLVSSEDYQEVTFIVPPNSTYSFSGPCYSFWELR